MVITVNISTIIITDINIIINWSTITTATIVIIVSIIVVDAIA